MYKYMHGIRRFVYGNVTPSLEINLERATGTARVQDFKGTKVGMLCCMYVG